MIKEFVLVFIIIFGFTNYSLSAGSSDNSGSKTKSNYEKAVTLIKSAKKYDSISFKKVIEKELKVMDMTAITLCKENNLPIGVLRIINEDSLLGFINGQSIGSIIS